MASHIVVQYNIYTPTARVFKWRQTYLFIHLSRIFITTAIGYFGYSCVCFCFYFLWRICVKVTRQRAARGGAERGAWRGVEIEVN